MPRTLAGVAASVPRKAALVSNTKHPPKFQEAQLRAALIRDAQWTRFVADIENARIVKFNPDASEKILRPSEAADRETASPFDPDTPYAVCTGRRS